MRSIRPEIEYAFEIITENVPISVSRLRIVFDDEIVSFDLTAALRRFGHRFDVQSGERRKAASEVVMKFRLGCELAYKAVAETVFIFNVQVAFLQRHINLVDQLNFNPNLPRRFYTVPDLRNRYTQVVAPVGDLSLSYTAEVDLDIFRADPATVHEMDVRDPSTRHSALSSSEPICAIRQARELRAARVRRVP